MGTKRRCHKKFKLLTLIFEGFTTDYLRQEKGTALVRTERFVISGPILIGTAIGAASIAIAGVTAHYVAKQETNRILEEEQAHRIEDVDNGIHNNWVNLNISVEIAKDIDNIRYTSPMSTHTINTVSHADQTNNEINHLFSRATTLEFSDPATEEWYTTIEEMNSRRSMGLTESEVRETARLSADLTSMVTMVV